MAATTEVGVRAKVAIRNGRTAAGTGSSCGQIVPWRAGATLRRVVYCSAGQTIGYHWHTGNTKSSLGYKT